MELITMTGKELKEKVKTGVELERKMNNIYCKLRSPANTLKEFKERCGLDDNILLYDLNFIPDWDKAFAAKHPHTGLVKYKMQKRKAEYFSITISLAGLDLYDTLCLAGIDPDTLENSTDARRAMDIFKVLEHCNWEHYSVTDANTKQIKLNKKDRRFIYDCAVNGWMCRKTGGRGFVSRDEIWHSHI